MSQKRWMLSLILFIFLGPIIYAHVLFYNRNHFYLATRCGGELVHPSIPVNISTSKPNYTFEHLNVPKWQLIYLSEQSNPEILKWLINIKSILGEHSIRVSVSMAKPSQLKPKNQNSALPKILTQSNQAVLIDPKSNLLMTYSHDTISKHPQKIVSDLKRLLKVSRIG